jgi:P4 family phage/plasmid primase-like protien
MTEQRPTLEAEIQELTEKGYLQEPTAPKRTDYNSDENYEFALNQYKEKLTVYTERLQHVKERNATNLAAYEAEQQKALERQKHIFHCFDKKQYPEFSEFCIETKESQELQALGCGGKRHFEFKVAEVAKWIYEHEHFKTDIDTKILYFFDGKRWIPNAEPYLEHLVNLILKQDAKVSHYRNIEFSLKALSYTKMTFSKKLALENGLLDVDTLEFTEYSTDTAAEMPFYYLPVKYDPKAECPQWEVFVKTILPESDIQLLQEWSGYLLYPDYKFQNLMWMIGKGRNGKGVWQRTMQSVLGYDNVSNLPLENFDGNHEFSLVNLYGKLANFSTEPKARNSKGEPIEFQTQTLKFATGQDMIDARVMYTQKPLRFTNTAKITISANTIPRIRDQTDAFKDRRLFLKFPFRFVGSEQIKNIEQNWLKGEHDERSGILNWMLKGEQQLLINGEFTRSLSQKEAEMEFLRATDNISAFIEECATFNKNTYSTRDDAKTAYQAYCDYYGLDAENDKILTAQLRATAHIKDTSKRVGVEKEKVRVWDGVTFKVIAEPDEPDEKTSKQTQKTLIDTKSGTDGTAGTRQTNPSNFGNSLKLDLLEKPVPSVPSVPNSNEIHYHRLPPTEPHICQAPNCEGNGVREATFESVTSDDKPLFICQSCLESLKPVLKDKGIKLVEDYPFREDSF